MDQISVQKLLSGREEWIETVIYNSKRFKQTLIDLGLPEEKVEVDVARYEDATGLLGALHSPVRIGPRPHYKDRDAYMARREKELRDAVRFVRSKVRDLLAKREYRVEESVIREVSVRMFWLTAPDVRRSAAVYKDEVTTGIGSGITMKVFGTGMGANQSVDISYSSEFEASDGACKSIFVHFPLEISLIATYEKGLLVGKGLRSEVPANDQRDFKLGIASETKEDCDLASFAAEIEEEAILLAQGLTDSIQTFTRTEEGRSKIELKSGLKVFNVDLTSKIEVERKNKVTLTFKLPAGRNYSLKRDRKGTGIWWG